MTGRDRGRVPFAVIGVLLLVSSMALATTMQPRRPPAETGVAAAERETEAAVRTAVRAGVHAAAERAARNPVVSPANTTYGRVLNESEAFRDYLRIRIYRQVRANLAAVVSQRQGVRTTAALPAIDNASDLRQAKRRVHVARATGGDGTAMRVRVENVTLTTRRGDRVLHRHARTVTLTVATPVLALHDRVSAYQTKLDAGLNRHGLAQLLTAQLYAMAWARSYAQFAGLPIDNIVTNRHLSLLTNLALIRLQQSTIGHSDPRGRLAASVAMARTAASHMLLAGESDETWLKEALKGPTAGTPGRVERIDPPSNGPRRHNDTTVGVNATARRAYADLRESGNLTETIRSVYSARVTFVADVERLGGDTPPRPAPPGEGWTVQRETTSRTVTSRIYGSFAPPDVPPGWHELDRAGQRVTLQYTRTVTWTKGNRTTVTNRSDVVTKRVSVAMIGKHAPSAYAPRRGIRTVHERSAGPFEGPNLAGIPAGARIEVLEPRGGWDAVVKRAAAGRLRNETTVIRGHRPRGIRRWLYRDLVRFRKRLRNVSVRVERGRVGAHSVNPPAVLAERLRDRRESLVGAPPTYGSVGEKLRFAARARLLATVIERLETRAAERRSRGGAVGAQLSGYGASMGMLQSAVGVSAGGSPRRQAHLAGVGGEARLRVDSAPSYLTLAKLDASEYPSLDRDTHPLVARNVNLFTVGYGDAIDAGLAGLFSSDNGVPLHAAAKSLRAANESLAANPNATMRVRRDALQSKVADSEAYVRDQLRSTLTAQGLDGATAGEAIRSGLSLWNTTATRSLALANRSATAPIMQAVRRRTTLNATKYDWIAIQLNQSLSQSMDDAAAKPPVGVVNRTDRVLRKFLAKRSKEFTANAIESGARTASDKVDGIPAGLPIVGTAWYATTNYWVVDVRGEYERFSVWANRGTPTDPGAAMQYARDGEPVKLDVDRDGTADRLGRSTKVSFDVTTVVTVVVPPGGTGVGDVGGDQVEESPGWPTAGPE